MLVAHLRRLSTTTRRSSDASLRSRLRVRGPSAGPPSERWIHKRCYSSPFRSRSFSADVQPERDGKNTFANHVAIAFRGQATSVQMRRNELEDEPAHQLDSER